jgi:DNA-binding transcriptional regulator YiaG
MRTTANAKLVDDCREKQSEYERKEFEETLLQREMLDAIMADMRDEYEAEMRAEYGGGDDVWDEMDAPRPRGPMPQSVKDKLRAQGKETPDDYARRRQQVAAQKVEREKQKEAKKEHDELPVQAKPTIEFRLMLQQARTAKKMTQEQLAQQCKVKKNIVADWEAGRVNVPPEKMKILKRILNL